MRNALISCALLVVCGATASAKPSPGPSCKDPHYHDFDFDGSITRLRGTWSKNADGTVRQLFEESKDGGVTWTVWFDGKYAAAK